MLKGVPLPSVDKGMPPAIPKRKPRQRQRRAKGGCHEQSPPLAQAFDGLCVLSSLA